MLKGKEEGRTWIPVAGTVRKDLIAAEMGHLSHEHVYVMAENEDYVVLRAGANQIPHSLYEIGRLREMIARESGEGTGKSLDIDHFDLYYIHFVIWDKKKEQIAGACRAGQVDIILKRFGRSGLETGTMFDYSPSFLLEMGAALEIGKLIIRAEYRRYYTPISLLCKGIGYFISYNPHYKILISATPISRKYSPLSVELIRSFLNRNKHSCNSFKYAQPKSLSANDGPLKKSGARARMRLNNIEKLSKIVSEIEPDGKSIPFSLKHYLKLGAKPIGFSIDPSFGRALTVLMLLDLPGCARGMLKRFLGSEGLERFREYHDSFQSRAA